MRGKLKNECSCPDLSKSAKPFFLQPGSILGMCYCDCHIDWSFARASCAKVLLLRARLVWIQESLPAAVRTAHEDITALGSVFMWSVAESPMKSLELALQLAAANGPTADRLLRIKERGFERVKGGTNSI